MPKTLDINDCVWTAIFRAIVRQVTTNKPVLAVVSADRIRSWEGKPTDPTPLVPVQGRPMIRLTPSPRSVAAFSPDTQEGFLDVVVELAVLTYCVDDPINLWFLLTTALKPNALDALGNTVRQNLVNAGAETGEILFSDPAVDTSIGSEPGNIMVAVGKFSLAVLTPSF